MAEFVSCGLPDLASLASPVGLTPATALEAIRILTERVVSLEKALDRMTDTAAECDRRAARMHRRAQRAEGVVRHVREGLARDIRDYSAPTTESNGIRLSWSLRHHGRLVDRHRLAEKRNHEESGR